MIVEETCRSLRRLYGEKLKGIGIEKAVVGIFFTGVKLSNGSGGISCTCAHSKNVRHASSGGVSDRKPPPGNMKGVSAYEVLNRRGDDPIVNAIRVAVMSALSSKFLTGRRYNIVYDRDALDMIDIGSAKRISIVGAFASFIERLKAVKGIELHVVEMRKAAVSDQDMRFFVPAEKASEVLPISDTVIITGSSVVNGTIDELLDYVKPGSMAAIVGPTGSFLPDAFFEGNVKMVSGTIITDSDKALEVISEGGCAYHLYDTCARKINLVRQ